MKIRNKKNPEAVVIMGHGEEAAKAQKKTLAVSLRWPEGSKTPRAMSGITLGKTVRITARGQIKSVSLNDWGHRLELEVPTKAVRLGPGSLIDDLKQMKAARRTRG